MISRLTAERGEVRSSSVRVRLQQSAQTMLDPRRPGDFNQAVMELGATVCLPRGPQCLLCPLREHCAARAEGIQNELPVKLNKRDAIKLAIELLLVEKDGRILMRQRSAHEPRLAGFWELPEPRFIPGARRTSKLGEFRHSITRHDYTVEVWQADPVKAPKGFRWIPQDELADAAARDNGTEGVRHSGPAGPGVGRMMGRVSGRRAGGCNRARAKHVQMGVEARA